MTAPGREAHMAKVLKVEEDKDGRIVWLGVTVKKADEHWKTLAAEHQKQFGHDESEGVKVYWREEHVRDGVGKFTFLFSKQAIVASKKRLKDITLVNIREPADPKTVGYKLTDKCE